MNKKSNRGSCILNDYSKLPIMKLEEVIKNFESKKSKTNTFRVNCQISKVHNQNFQKMLKLYSPKNNKYWEFSDFDKAIKEAKDVFITYFNVFTLKEGKN